MPACQCQPLSEGTAHHPHLPRWGSWPHSSQHPQALVVSGGQGSPLQGSQCAPQLMRELSGANPQPCWKGHQDTGQWGNGRPQSAAGGGMPTVPGLHPKDPWHGWPHCPQELSRGGKGLQQNPRWCPRAVGSLTGSQPECGVTLSEHLLQPGELGQVET